MRKGISMAIKKVTFSFDVPITQLLGLIATGNAAMKVDVYGDDKVMNGKLTGPRIAGLLEAPGRRRSGPRKRDGLTAYRLLLNQFADEQKRQFAPVELAPPLVEKGLSPKSVSPQLTLLRKHGNVKRYGNGKYQITVKGAAAHAKLVASEAKEAAT